MRITTEITAPTIEPITTEEARKFIGVGGSLDKTESEQELDSLITASRLQAEEFTDSPFIIRQFSTTYDRIGNNNLQNKSIAFASNSNVFFMELPKQPIVSITDVKWYNINDVEHTLDSGLYSNDTEKIIFDINAFPNALRKYKSLKITYTAGFGTTQSSIPEDIKLGIKFYLADFYANKIDYRGKATSKKGLQPNNNAQKAEMLLSKYSIMHKLLDGEL